jgi:hypothetical protein
MSTNYMDLVKNGVPKKIKPGPINFIHLFDEFVASTPKTWAHDRAKSVGASEAFGCIRNTFFGKRGKELGFEEDAGYTDSWGAVRRGDLIENYHVVPALEAGFLRRGMKLTMAGEGQDTIVDGVTSATLDGLVINAPRDALAEYGVADIETDCFVLEMKSFDPRIKIAEEKAIHRGQTQMQLGLIRKTTKYKPVYAIILYVQCSWLDDVRPFAIKWDENVYDIGVARNTKVFTEDDPAKFGPEGKIMGLCAYCKHTTACAAVTTGRVPPKVSALKAAQVREQDQGVLDELASLVMEADARKKDEKEAKAAHAELQESVKQILIGHQISRAVGEGWKVSYTSIDGASRLSKSKMIAAGLDPDDFTEGGPGYDKLTITVA